MPTEVMPEYRIVEPQCVPGVQTHLGRTSKLYFLHVSGHRSTSSVSVSLCVHAEAATAAQLSSKTSAGHLCTPSDSYPLRSYHTGN